MNISSMSRKEDIPAATQLFTPDWIVKYMVDNSLGKYLIENGYIELEKKLNYLVSDSYTVKNNIDVYKLVENKQIEKIIFI